MAALPVFTKDEYVHAHELLAARVAAMLGRKFEEGDWSHVYCAAKGIPETGWSNLSIDVAHNGLGVEHKMLCRPSKASILDACGQRPMHPSATRSIRVDGLDPDPTEAAKDVLRQYGELITERRLWVAQQTDVSEAAVELRTGWLLWQDSLEEFLYFEELMSPPNPNDYYAIWKESGGGRRKASRNLWIYEKATDIKRYSITTVAGAKIQPYFDIPGPTDPNLYFFRVQGEEFKPGVVRVWITAATATALKQLLGGNLELKGIRDAISAADQSAQQGTLEEMLDAKLAISLEIDLQTYQLLTETFEGVSDEHRFQQLANFLSAANSQ